MNTVHARRARKSIDDVRLEGYAMAPVAVPVPATPTATRHVVINPVLEQRLYNWRDTLYGYVGGMSGNICASWATAYVASRNERERQLAISLEIVRPSSKLESVHADELDGWIVEAAVRTMSYYDQRQVLRYKFVWGYSNHFIKTKLQINDTAILIVLGRALKNLQIELDKLNTPAKIRSNNSHARYVPRLEALAVPVGTAAPLGCDPAE